MNRNNLIKQIKSLKREDLESLKDTVKLVKERSIKKITRQRHSKISNVFETIDQMSNYL